MSNLWFFIRLYRRYYILLFSGVFLAIITLLAGISLLSLSGWFITSTAIAGMTLTTAQTFNFFTPGAAVRGFSMLRTAARYGERLVSHDATFRLLSWLRSWFFRRLIPVSPVEVSKPRNVELLDRLVADIDALDQLYLSLISPLISAVLVITTLSFFLAFFSMKLAFIILIMMLGWIVIIPSIFFLLGHKVGVLLGIRLAELRQAVLDYLQTMAEHQIYDCDHSGRQLIISAEQRLNANQATMSMLDSLSSAFLVVGSGLSVLLALYFGSYELELSKISGPVFVMSVFAVLAGFEALIPLPAAFQFLSHTMHAACRIKAVLNRPVVNFGKTEKAKIKGVRVSFNNVSGGYHTCNSQYHYRADSILVPVIENLSLTIPSGCHVAIVGETGSGKSTLVNLLSRRLDPSSGDIHIGDQALASLSETALYEIITVVPQKTFVFSGTLRANLKLAAPLATDEQLLEMVCLTGLDTLAAVKQESCSNAILDLMLGHGGITLSGGEQRRLVIARALLKPAPIIVMDEPAEGLDINSEKTLLNMVLKMFRQRTVIMITHKTCMLERMDRVYEMMDGYLQRLDNGAK